MNESVKKLKNLWEVQIRASKPKYDLNAPLINIKSTRLDNYKTADNAHMKKWQSLELINNQNNNEESRKVAQINDTPKNGLNKKRTQDENRTVNNSKQHLPISKFKSIEEIRMNMLSVLSDIKNLDQSKIAMHEKSQDNSLVNNKSVSVSVSNDSKCKIKENENQQDSEIVVENPSDNNLREDKLVKMLKEKFEKEDQAFIKVCSKIFLKK